MNRLLARIISTLFSLTLTLAVCFAAERVDERREVGRAVRQQSLLEWIIFATPGQIDNDLFRPMHSGLIKLVIGGIETGVGIYYLDKSCPGFARGVLNSIFSFTTYLGNYKYGSSICETTLLTTDQGQNFFSGERFGHDALLCLIKPEDMTRSINNTTETTTFPKHALCDVDKVFDERVQYMGTPFETLTWCQKPVTQVLAEQYMTSAFENCGPSWRWYRGAILTGHGVLQMSMATLQIVDSTIKGVLIGSFRLTRALLFGF